MKDALARILSIIFVGHVIKYEYASRRKQDTLSISSPRQLLVLLHSEKSSCQGCSHPSLEFQKVNLWTQVLSPYDLTLPHLDHVCGSAHCLLTPYWAQKHHFPVDTSMQARQVSPRGGLLRVRWIPPTDGTGGFVNIGGEVVAWGRGNVLI